MITELKNMISENDLKGIMKLKEELEELEKYVPVECMNEDNYNARKMLDEYLKPK